MNSRSVAAALAAVALAVTSGSAQVQKSEMPGVTNFSRIGATVGCGGTTQATAMPALKQGGFVSVINLRMASEPGADVEGARAAAQAAGLKYIHLPMDGSKPDPRTVDSFLAAVADKSNQPVYIHCASANRVGSVWMIKRVLQDGWAVDEAQREAEAIGLSSTRLKAFAHDYISTHKK